MSNGILQFVLIFGFMLIPVWIPIIGFVLGGVSDLVRATGRKRASDTTRRAPLPTPDGSRPEGRRPGGRRPEAGGLNAPQAAPAADGAA